MKKKLIYAAVVSALLSGCGGSDDNTGDTSSYLDYLLSGSNAVRPSALAARATDGTLKFSTETADLSNPVSALSTLDGWSTTQAIQIVPVTSGIQVKAPAAAEFTASVAPLYLMELEFDSAALRPSGVKKVLTYGVDFVVAETTRQAESGAAQAAQPLFLLHDSGDRYPQRQHGRPLRPGSDYSNYKTSTGSNAQEQTISGLIALQEGLFKAATGITSDHVIFSDWFGTQSGADVLVAVKGAAASVLKSPTLDAAALWKQDAPGQYQPAWHLYPVGERRQPLPDPAGCRELPAQEQKDAIAAAFGDALHSTIWPWVPPSTAAPSSCPTSSPRPPPAPGTRRRPSPGTVPSQPLRHRERPEGPGCRSDRRPGGGGYGSRDEHRALQPAAGTGRGAVRPDADLRRRTAGEHHRRDHLSARRHLGEGKRLCAGPWPNWCRCPGEQERGRGGDRSSLHVNAFALTGSMDSVTTSDNPTPYLNLSYLTVARDNLKQSVAICWACVWQWGWPMPRAIGTAGSLKVHFLGHSLGASRGPTCWRWPTSLLATRRRRPVQVRHWRPGHAGRHSAAVAELAAFGPTIQMSVLTAGSAALKAAFTAYAPNCKTASTDLLRQRVPAEPGCGHPGHGGQHPAELQLRAQSVLDSADPINLGSGIRGLPAVCHRNRRRGALSLSDRVIPNSIATAPPGWHRAAVQGPGPATADRHGPPTTERPVSWPGVTARCWHRTRTSIRPAPSPPRCRPSSAASSQAAVPRSR
uniref:Extracellular lipase n=1 Tax=Aeromonas hydrophila TaxID=644 RepID=O05484_AERHY|nr:extracellular lipase [Aeromonas hydrophila]